jgi:hypothetical protein
MRFSSSIDTTAESFPLCTCASTPRQHARRIARADGGYPPSQSEKRWHVHLGHPLVHRPSYLLCHKHCLGHRRDPLTAVSGLRTRSNAGLVGGALKHTPGAMHCLPASRPGRGPAPRKGPPARAPMPVRRQPLTARVPSGSGPGVLPPGHGPCHEPPDRPPRPGRSNVLCFAKLPERNVPASGM